MQSTHSSIYGCLWQKEKYGNTGPKIARKYLEIVGKGELLKIYKRIA